MRGHTCMYVCPHVRTCVCGEKDEERERKEKANEAKCSKG